MPADLIGDGARWLAGQRADFLSRPVQFVGIDGATTLSIVATRGRTTFETGGQEGVVERFESDDWLIATGDLPREPRRGDRITETVGGSTFIFEATGEAGVPPFHWCDASRTGYRIHTKLVSTVPAP